MGDSEEEHDQKRRDRNKFKRERENLDEEESDNKRKILSSALDFDPKWKTKRDYSPTNRSIKRIKRDVRDIRNFNMPWHPWDVHTQDYGQPSNPAKISGLDDPEKITILTFKQFMMEQDDLIDEKESVKKYSEYKQSINANLISSFFDKHKNEEWFQKKYHPDINSRFLTKMRFTFLQRFISFWFLYNKGFFLNFFLDNKNHSMIEILLKRSLFFMERGTIADMSSSIFLCDISNPALNITIPSVEQETHQNPDTTSVLHSEDGEVTEDCEYHSIVTDNKRNEESPKVDVTNSILKSSIICPKAIFIKGFPPSIRRQDIEDSCKTFDKLIRIFLTDPIKLTNCRNAWLTFTSNVDISSVISHLELYFNKTNFDFDVVFSVVETKDPEIRTIGSCLNALDVVISDLNLAIQLVKEFDAKNEIFSLGFNISDILNELSIDVGFDNLNNSDGNPLLKNIPTDNDLLNIKITLAAAEKAEEEEEGVIPSEICYKRDDHLFRVLDTLILYLRIVYSYDFYSFTTFSDEDLMPCRISFISVRGNINNSASIQDVNNLIEDHKFSIGKLNNVEFLTETEMSELGRRIEIESIESFIKENTKMLEPEKYLCPLSGKKFKGPEYVKKHIYNKHNEKIQEVKLEVQYFNNYLKDKNRPITEVKLPQNANSNFSQYQADKSDDKISHSIHNPRAKDIILPSQNWPFHPNFLVPPHAPPVPPPFEYNRFPSFSNMGNKRNIPKKFDDTRKPISYKDWDDPNLDN